MKTIFPPVMALLLATLLIPQTNRASSPPVLDEDGESLELAPAATLASAELQPGPAKVAGRNVNVRAKATIRSEVITQLQDGDEVFVEEVILRPEATGKDPARWAKIAYPTQASAWVHSLYIDPATSTVKPKKLNVRSGPGENHTIVGSLSAGDTVAQLGSKGDWLLIQPPEGTTAYIAAKLLRQQAPPATGIAAAGAKPQEEETEIVETEVVETRPEIAEGAEAGEPEMAVVEEESTAVESVGGTTGITDTEAAAGATDLQPLPETPPPLEIVSQEPLPPRVVQREGIVRAGTSIQAPSDYKLVSQDNGRFINYLWTTSTNLELGRYVGLHIVATGEESLDQRWPGKPVLTLKRIVLVE